MNKDNKISSVRPGTINIELGLDLYMLLYYRGLRSVDDIYRLHSAHTENDREPSVHCNKNDINGIKLCLSFSQGLKFPVVYFFKCSSFWGTPSPDLLPGLRPWTPLVNFRPPDSLTWPLIFENRNWKLNSEKEIKWYYLINQCKQLLFIWVCRNIHTRCSYPNPVPT